MNEGDKSKTEAKGAPETYADYKAPEGYEFDKERVASVNAKFKEMNLTQDQAQSLMDEYGKAITEAEESPYKLWAETQEKWRNEVAASDLGPKIDQVKTTISKALDSLGDPKMVADYKGAMDFTGAGNNLSFIRVLHALALKVTEPGAVAGTKPSAAGQPSNQQTPRSAAQAMYPNLPSGG